MERKSFRQCLRALSVIVLLGVQPVTSRAAQPLDSPASPEAKAVRCAWVNGLDRSWLYRPQESRHAPVTADVLVAIIADPHTSFSNRMAWAKTRPSNPHALPGKILPLLKELENEESVHDWGLISVNCSNALLLEWEAEHEERRRRVTLMGDGRQRRILGLPWRLPDYPADYWPAAFEEWEAAPWPLQVKFALGELLRLGAPQAGRSPSLSLSEKNEADSWFAAFLDLDTDDPWMAVQFVLHTHDVRHKNIPLLARYREILQNPELREAAFLIPHALWSFHHWGDPRRQDYGQVLIIDTLASPQTPEVKQGLGPALITLRDRPKRYEKHQPLPEPATAILAAVQYGLNSANGDTWTRLSCYLIPALSALDLPPPGLSKPGDDEPARAKQLKQVQDWLDGAGGDRLRRLAVDETSRLQEARTLLERSAQDRRHGSPDPSLRQRPAGMPALPGDSVRGVAL